LNILFEMGYLRDEAFFAIFNYSLVGTYYLLFNTFQYQKEPQIYNVVLLSVGNLE